MDRKTITRQQLQEQREYIDKVKRHYTGALDKRYAFVDTFGCQQNEADSERIRGMLAEMGFEMTGDENEADIIVINTCAVREHAEQRVYGNVGALVHSKSRNPDQIICLCGCMVQQPAVAEKIKKSYRHVDLVFGPQALWRFPEFICRALLERGRIFEIEDTDAIAEGLPVLRSGGIKAWVSVMYGCNNFCSYCIVPYVRGRERSRMPEDILGEIKELTESGYGDITLLGQNVNSYGKDLESDIDFSDLLRMANDIDGEFLIRFMTSHPKDASQKLFDTMAACGKVAKQLHLPFQAGNDRVLERMNRRYTAEQYLDLISRARSAMPDIVLTSDVIVGFPGETDEEFEDTLKLVEKVRFDALFTFIYSKRSGTPAAGYDDKFTKEDKQRRFDRLVQAQNRISAEIHSGYRGRQVRVLVDGYSGDERNNLTARTEGGRLVRLCGSEELIGKFVDVLITDNNTWSLTAEIT